VVELTDVPRCTTGAPSPIVLSNEFALVLAYIIYDRTYGTALRTGDDGMRIEPIAVVRFEHYESFMFGAPNDEALHGHPLFARGMTFYSAFRVENSSWVRQLERMNSVHPNHDPEYFEKLKHFVFTFHDSTFECVAKSFAVSEYEGPFEGLVPVMQSRLTSG
jgi:hypothetical protein